MRKIIIIFLCCGVLVSMVGCGVNTAPSPTDSPPTMAITEAHAETILPTTAIKPTEKEKESPPTENEAQATEPTMTATEPATTAKPKEQNLW